MIGGKRSFTIENSEVKIASTDGRYISATPGSAAAKAARRIFDNVKGKKDEVRFTLRETTQGSKNKEFKYIAIKRKLEKPKVVSIAGTNVTYHHEYKIKSCKI